MISCSSCDPVKLFLMKQTFNVNIESQEPLPTPDEIRRELPISPEASDNVYAFRKAIMDILDGRDRRLMVIAGPCSVDNMDACGEYARRLAGLAREVSGKLLVIMRAYLEKPRTVVGWKGMIYDPMLDGSCRIEKGIRISRKFLIELAEMGLPAATEMLEPVIPQYVADLISWAAIGARTTESQTHRQLASGLSMPVGFKNTTDGDIQVAVEAIRAAAAQHSFLGVIDDGRTGIFRTRGNKYCHLILRGGTSGPNYGSEYVAFAKEIMRKSGINPAVIIDCSHGNSGKDCSRQAAVFHDSLRQVCRGGGTIKGLMLESYLHQGRQELAPDKMLPGLSITDACIGWEETETLIRHAHKEIP